MPESPASLMARIKACPRNRESSVVGLVLSMADLEDRIARGARLLEEAWQSERSTENDDRIVRLDRVYRGLVDAKREVDELVADRSLESAARIRVSLLRRMMLAPDEPEPEPVPPAGRGQPVMVGKKSDKP